MNVGEEREKEKEKEEREEEKDRPSFSLNGFFLSLSLSLLSFLLSLQHVCEIVPSFHFCTPAKEEGERRPRGPNTIYRE